MIAREDYTDTDTIDAEDRSAAPVPAWLARYPTAPDPCIYRGVIGDMVRELEPHTEADPVAILVQALAAFGNVIGRTAYFRTEATRHYGNLFVVLVAPSSKGRKGTAWAQARQAIADADPTWRVVSGLVSGEGLIWHVRDAAMSGDADSGVTDKRLFIMEPEFAKVLRVVERDGSTLSPVLREAWDSGCLTTLAKNAPTSATDAHVSFVGHITADELRRYLTATESANGFGNRFLWVCAKRARYLPDGGDPDERRLKSIREQFAIAIQCAREFRECRRDARAGERWRAVYRELSDGKPGLLGSMTGRAEAQVMRLAMLYALSDAQSTIELEHLNAALALWRYCFESARYVFGDSLGDRVADDIHAAIVEAGGPGITRTELSNALGRNRSRTEIARGLARLADTGLVRFEHDSSGVGRPIERWYSVRTTN